MDVDSTAMAAPAILFPGADIILKTEDGVTFHVQKQILRQNSELYGSMFAVAPAQDNQTLQTVPVPLKSRILLHLLQILYQRDVIDTFGVPFGSIDEALEHIRGAELL